MARLSLTERFSDVDLQPSTFAHIPHFNLKKCLILISFILSENTMMIQTN